MQAEAAEDRGGMVEIGWRLEVLTPLHVGAGEGQLVKGIHAASVDGFTYVVDLDRLCAALPPSAWDRLASGGLAAVYADRPLREVQRWAVPGELRGPAGHARLRPFARDAFGRPYLPGSTLKGALRTALLGRRFEDDAAVREALRATAAGHDPAPGLLVEQAALRVRERAAVDDLLRHLHVPDVLVPPGSLELVAVKVASMGEAGRWGWKRRGRPNAEAQDEEGVAEVTVEALRPGTVLRVPLRVDARRLEPTGFPRPGRPVPPDFSGSRELLLEGLVPAARAHGIRVLEPEAGLWSGSRPHAGAAEAVARLMERVRAAETEAVLPLGWGIGWRSVTGGLLERVDEGPRATDAGAEDPPALAAARPAHSLGRRGFGVFPKTRRLAGEGVPLGWVAARRWSEGDEATALTAAEVPEGVLGGEALEAHRLPERAPRERWRERERERGPAAAAGAGAEAGAEAGTGTETGTETGTGTGTGTEPGTGAGAAAPAPREARPPREDRGPRPDRPPREDRGPRPDRPPREDRGPRPERPPREPGAAPQDRGPRPDRPPRQDRPGPPRPGGPGGPRGERPGERRDDRGGPPRRGPAAPPQPTARAGDRVKATLLEEKSKKGKWRARTESGAVGAIEAYSEPEGLEAGQVVELVVKNTAALGQDWTFIWPKYAEEQAAAAAAAAAKGRKR